MHSFDWGPLPPPSVYLGRQNVVHVIKWTRPPPSVFAYCRRSKTGLWEGLGMRRCLSTIWHLVLLQTLACKLAFSATPLKNSRNSLSVGISATRWLVLQPLTSSQKMLPATLLQKVYCLYHLQCTVGTGLVPRRSLGTRQLALALLGA